VAGEFFYMKLNVVCDQFRQEIEGSGLTPPDAIVPDKEIHRFPTNGDRLDTAGWYVFHPDGLPAGEFGDFRSGLVGRWCAKSEKALS
jgi:putative DNA primase/helicase